MQIKTINFLNELKVGNIFEIKQEPTHTFVKVINLNDLYNLYAVNTESFSIHKMINIKPEDIIVYPNAKMDLRFIAHQ